VSDGEPSGAKARIVEWVRETVSGFAGVAVSGLGGGWGDGLALCALASVLEQRRNGGARTIDYEACLDADPVANLQLAISTAESQLGIPRLLEPEDFAGGAPDERSLLTCVV
jgi:hypothetical protein